MSDSTQNGSKSVQPEDGSNERADHPPQIDSIPGGEKQSLPEEPTPPPGSNQSTICIDSIFLFVFLSDKTI